MAEGFKSFIVSALLIGLFIYSLISFGYQLSVDNNSNQSILQQDTINRSYSPLEANLTNVRGTADSQRENFQNENPTISSDSLVFTTIPRIANVFTNILVNIYNLTFGLIAEVLGINPIVMGIFLAIIVITAIFLIWRVIKAGD